MKTISKAIKSTSINIVTGETHETRTVQKEYVYKRPDNGYKGVYLKKLGEALMKIQPNAGRLLFAIEANINDYNKLCVSWKELLDISPSAISQLKRELIDNELIAKIGKSWVLNPFVVLPRYQTQAPEVQNEVQMIYRRYVENMNDWYEGIDEDTKDLYGVSTIKHECEARTGS